MEKIFTLDEEQWQKLMAKHKRNTWLPKLQRLAEQVSQERRPQAREMGEGHES
jgi:hypothetical protein